MENAITEVKGKENLKTYKLREGSQMSMLVCTKCHYVMVNSHEGYEGNIVLVKARTAECEKLPVHTRGCEKEWPTPQRVGPVPGPDRPIPPLENPNVVVVRQGFWSFVKAVWKLSFM